ALLVVVAGWLLPQADVSVITVLIGLGVGVGAGLGGGALGVLRRPEAAVGAGVGLAVLAALVAVDGVHGTAWAGLVDGVAGGGDGGGGSDGRCDVLGGGELAHGHMVRFAGRARSA